MPPQATINDIIDRSLLGDRSARQELALCYLERVHKTVTLTTGRRDDVEDIVQNVMIDIFAGLHNFRRDSSFSTWVDTVSVNAVRRYYRRHPFKALVSASNKPIYEDAHGSYTERPDRITESRLAFENLTRLLETLKPVKRTAIVLYLAYGYTMAEISQMTDSSTETVKKRIQSARRELLRKIERPMRLPQGGERL